LLQRYKKDAWSQIRGQLNEKEKERRENEQMVFFQEVQGFVYFNIFYFLF
jgi:hypothetical protein